MRPSAARFVFASFLGATLLCATEAMAWPEGEEETVIELHFTPVANTQIAIWLSDADGNYIRDVFLTQAIGKLGIGNRSGIWNFLSSWRAPYGPRKSALPIWAHARGVTYPKIIFHDDTPGHETSLGFHESFSSSEPFHCRPLMPMEHEAILDSMTCPSPSTFRTDKGRFDPQGASSVYPPRGDIGTFDETKDHVDIMMYGELNVVDAVTAATPPGNVASIVTLKLSDEEKLMTGLQVWFEINKEADENADWTYTADDHFVDPLLSSYGINYLGQPSLVYTVSFDPTQTGTWATSDYYGYGSWNGDEGLINPPDATISTSQGSGADRIQLMQGFDQSFRLAVHTGEGGTCATLDLPPVEDVTIVPIDFDRVEIGFTIPANMPDEVLIRRLEVKYDIDATQETYEEQTALDASTFVPPLCTVDESGAAIEEGDCLPAMPGSRVEFEVASLFGNYDYAFAMSYGDQCANVAEETLGSIRTPAQAFQQVDTFCFVATAAYGAHWGQQVWALRRFRDHYLVTHELGRALVRTYYAYGPTVAKQIHGSALLRAAARGMLNPLALAAGAISPV